MRIAIICPVIFGPEGIFGGGERYPQEIGRALASLCQEVVLVSFGTAAREYTDSFGLCHVVFPVSRGAAPDPDAFSSHVFHIARKYDVVYLHTINKLAILVAAQQQLRRAPAFLTPHGGGGRSGIRRLGLYRLFRGFLLVSRYSLVAYPWASRRPHCVIYGGGNAAAFSSFVPDFSRPRENRVAYVGRITPHKGLDVLLQALPNDLELVLCGQIHDTEYARYLERLGNKKRLQFLSQPDDATLSEIYSSSRAVILPSTTQDYRGRPHPHPELLGLVLLEAMWHGTPVIASAVGGVPEIVQDGKEGFLVPPGDVRQLRDRLIDLLNDSSLVMRMGRMGRIKVESHFTWQHVAARALTFMAEASCLSPAVSPFKLGLQNRALPPSPFPADRARYNSQHGDAHSSTSSTRPAQVSRPTTNALPQFIPAGHGPPVTPRLRRLLDVGSGPNPLVNHARICTVGLDVNLAYLHQARMRNPHALLVCGRAEALPFRSGSFDEVRMWEVLEHLGDKEAAVKELARVLTPGGTALISAALLPTERLIARFNLSYKRTVLEGFHRGATSADECLRLLGAHFVIRQVSYDKWAGLECLYRAILMHLGDAQWIESGEFIGRSARWITAVAAFLTRVTWRLLEPVRILAPAFLSKSIIVHAVRVPTGLHSDQASGQWQ